MGDIFSIILTALNIVITSLVAIYVVNLRSKFDKEIVILKSKLGRKQKIDELMITELVNLRTKMHDRLTEVELAIKSNKYPDDKSVKRLLMTASRLTIYDQSIINDVYLVLNDWVTSLALQEQGVFKGGNLSVVRKNDLEIIQMIKKKVDNILVKSKK